MGAVLHIVFTGVDFSSLRGSAWVTIVAAFRDVAAYPGRGMEGVWSLG